MASLRIEARHRVDKSSQQRSSSPKSASTAQRLPLSRKALRALDKGNRPARPTYPSPPSAPIHDLTPAITADLARLAKHGGPDLRDLRGYHVQVRDERLARAMSSRQSQALSQPTSSTAATSRTGSQSINAYHRDFERNLLNHSIHPINGSEKPDLTEAMAALPVRRASLSPDRFTEQDFDTLRTNHELVKNETEVVAHIVSKITGPLQRQHPSSADTVFGNLDVLTDGTIVRAKPDLYYGANLVEVNRSVLAQLDKHISPSTQAEHSLAPNFFVEAKGPDGRSSVLQKQIRYDGAIGSRCMHSLQNYGVDNPQYDGRARSFSATYLGTTLQLYAHHVTAPRTKEDRPGYHTTELRAYAITDQREMFIQGVTAFRNLRDFAKRERDALISAANARAPPLHGDWLAPPSRPMAPSAGRSEYASSDDG